MKQAHTAYFWVGKFIKILTNLSEDDLRGLKRIQPDGHLLLELLRIVNRCQIFCAFLPNDTGVRRQRNRKIRQRWERDTSYNNVFCKRLIFGYSATLIHESSGIAAMFVTYDLLTSLDVYLRGCMRKSHRHEAESLTSRMMLLSCGTVMRTCGN